MKESFTKNQGASVSGDQNFSTIRNNGPVLLHDVRLIEKLAHFNRERIPERIVHAKGAGAGSYFEVTKDLTNTQKQNFSQKWKTNRSVREVFYSRRRKRVSRCRTRPREDSR